MYTCTVSSTTHPSPTIHCILQSTTFNSPSHELQQQYLLRLNRILNGFYTRTPNQVSGSFSFFVLPRALCVIVAFPFLFIDRIVGTKPQFLRNILFYYLFRIPLTVQYFRVHRMHLICLQYRITTIVVPMCRPTYTYTHIVHISGLCTFFTLLSDFGYERCWVVDGGYAIYQSPCYEAQPHSANKLTLLNLLDLFEPIQHTRKEPKNLGLECLSHMKTQNAVPCPMPL